MKAIDIEEIMHSSGRVKFEGRVEDINGETITAMLFTKDDDSGVLKFNIKDVDPSDLDLLREGALFNLFIGYKKNAKEKKKEKIFEFRRISLKENMDKFLDSIAELDYENMIKKKGSEV